ncbi:hypothetical protein VKT23_007990 [Stygiomarasmius scandens]|uniref:HET-domain-containing protein n=1 Tax=Marasmiellus scandens TaxID=2682957 RepID=A0ABR1JJ03_9AGAR
MRLLNTKTFHLAEFYTDIPTYAILSHTWEKEEVTFQDIQNLDIAKRKVGWQKINNACTYARRYHFEWIWIDTCCIDKCSSAELSEAINSMYQYYEDSQVCYAYLCDVSSEEDPRDANAGFRKSKWFERGWTLQELIAPRYVVILDKEWKEVGTRWSLRDAISAITSIPIKVLEDGDTEGYSIAQKMSWAAWRKTTRPEDMAYCLMGLFGVNMPPIYGEGGSKAFMRLQQEIIKYSDDRSIFAWIAECPSQYNHNKESRGLLARSPYEFRVSSEVSVSQSDLDKSSFSFGNNGLHINLPLFPVAKFGDDVFLASLDCCTQDGRHIGLYLEKINGHQYVRYLPDQLPLIDRLSPNSFPSPRELVVKETCTARRILMPEKDEYNIGSRKIHIELLSPQIIFIRRYLVQQYPLGMKICSENPKTITIGPGHEGATLALEYRTKAGEQYIIAFDIEPGLPGVLMHIGLVEDSRYQPDWINIGKLLHRGGRVLSPLEGTDTGLLSCAVQMTGNSLESILEVDYILESSPSYLPLRRILPPPAMGFNIQTAATSCVHFMSTFLLFQEAFPPNFSSRADSDLDITFISVSDEPQNKWRVLAYKRTSNVQKGAVYVVLGLHESGNPWIYLISKSNERLETEKIWKSYLDSGSRAKIRQDCQRNKASVQLTNNISMAVTLEERTILQLGVYTLKRAIHGGRRHLMSWEN